VRRGTRLLAPRVLMPGALALVATACGGASTATPVTPVGWQGYAIRDDTLRFREVSTGDIRFTTPQGEMAMKSEHDATIAITRVGGDTARAWYEALAIGMTSPMGAGRPATEAALRQPFTLRIDGRGRITLLQAPTFPASFEGITDLTQQFADFLPRLPAAPLRVGLAWTDTATRTDSTARRAMRSRSIATYRVERDTVVNGQPALVVSMRQEIGIRSAAPIPSQNARAEIAQDGTENGFFVFAPATGRLVARRREGRLEGDVVTTGPNGRTTMKQVYAYTSSIDALP
jgi:hypothetical protein